MRWWLGILQQEEGVGCNYVIVGCIAPDHEFMKECQMTLWPLMCYEWEWDSRYKLIASPPWVQCGGLLDCELPMIPGHANWVLAGPLQLGVDQWVAMNMMLLHNFFTTLGLNVNQ